MPKLKLLLLSLLVVLGLTSAKHLILRPLRGEEEIRELELADRSEGRSVRSGLAALTGYTLGLSKALVGVFIYDVITANVSSTEGESASETNNRYAQQVCFNSAGNEILARSNDEYEYVSEYNPYEDEDVYDSNNLGRQTDTDTLTSTDTDTFLDTNVANSNVATCIILYRNR